MTADGAQYILAKVDDKVGFFKATGTIAAGKGYLELVSAVKAENNDLKGAATDVEAAGKYVLAQPEGQPVGFYKANEGTIKAGKAYIEVPATEVKVFYFNGEDATGINGLNDVNDLNDAAIYNVAGQRVSKLQKGINIVNGKKVLK